MREKEKGCMENERVWRADLHIHSIFSDGSRNREEILQMAGSHGIECLSFTEHDCVDEAEDGVTLGRTYGIQVIPGVEISAWDPDTGTKAHILGYGYTKTKAVRELCSPLLLRRHQNGLKQIEILQTLGYDITPEKVLPYAEHVIYKQHILKFLADSGQTQELFGAVYRDVFKNGGPCDFDIKYLDVREAVRAVCEDGGRAVLAHPGQQNNFYLVPELVKGGLFGIEKYHPAHGLEEEQTVERLCCEYGLYCSGGSDFHGSYAMQQHPVGYRGTPESFLLALQNSFT